LAVAVDSVCLCPWRIRMVGYPPTHKGDLGRQEWPSDGAECPVGEWPVGDGPDQWGARSRWLTQIRLRRRPPCEGLIRWLRVARLFSGPSRQLTYRHTLMKYATVLASLSLMAGCTDAGTIGGFIQAPPVRYDKPAFNVSVQYTSKSQIRRFCGDAHARGCAYAHSKGCTIIVPPGTGTGSRFSRHEMALQRLG
jgi:hypothetical protein